MNDKSWLLKPSAIKAAKICVQLVQRELDVRLPLSHPEFLEMLNDYAELAESTELSNAVNELNAMAGTENAALETRKTGTGPDKVVPHPRAAANNPAPESKPAEVDKDEMVTYNGKEYPRWSGDKEFSGLYRGQPRYQ